MTDATAPIAPARADRGRDRAHFLFLNVGHFIDHLMTLIFATVAALALHREWGVGYDALLPYAMPGFVAFGLFALPAGWLADRWSREGMIAVFFVGIGLSAIATAFAQSPLQLCLGLFVIGVFAAIYHPVGLAIVIDRYARTGMALGINGIWGNLGVGSAALITGYLIDHGGWRSAFWVPGIASILVGIAYTWAYARPAFANLKLTSPASTSASKPALPVDERRRLLRLLAIVFVTTALSGIIFQSTTFALPKVMEERLTEIAPSATQVGLLTFLIFAIAAVAQLIVGATLDVLGPRTVFMAVTLIQTAFFAAMPGSHGWMAVIIGLGFMLGAFGQIPINDYMIGKVARPELRASIYGVRYMVTFAVLAMALPLIAVVHDRWGFDMLFRILSVLAALTFLIVTLLPRRLGVPQEPTVTSAVPNSVR